MSSPAAASPQSSALLPAIVLKEMRDRLKTAFVCLAIVVVGQLISLGFQRMMESSGVYFVGSGSLFSFSIFTLTSALSGLIIGRALIVHENRGDRWGFLAHRPVHRSTLFFGKAVAGALLYLAATGIPLAFATAWMAAPGSRPVPWDSSMALPGVADMLCGLVYLLAAMLVSMREARWYGSRFLPLGAAIACTGVVLEVSYFWQALAIVLLGMVVVGTAALTTFASGGQYKPLSRWGRATLGLTIVPGLVLAGTFVIAVTALTAFSRKATRNGVRSTDYVIASDGSIVQRVELHDLFAQTTRVLAVKDLHGRAVEQYQDSAAREKLTAGVIATPALKLHPDNPGTLESMLSGYRGTYDLFVQLSSSPPAPSELSWYFVRRLGLIAAYNNRSARLIGWMGPDGFSPGEARPAHRFEGALRPTSEYGYIQPVLAFPSAVYRLDLRQRGIRKVFTPSARETVLGAATSGDSTAAMAVYGPRAKFDAIATNTSVHVQAPDGTAELSVARDSGDSASATVTVSRALLAAGTPTFFWYSSSYRPFIQGEPRTPAGHVKAFNDENKLVAQVAIPRDTEPEAESRVTAEDVFSAATVSVTWRFARRVYYAYRRPSGFPAAGQRKWQQSDVVDWSVSAMTSLLAAALTFGLGGIFAFDRNRRLLWGALGFVLGPLGVLLMLSLIDWPVREPCPSCGKKRVVTRARCEHCDAPFSPPALDGTEIFETAVA